MLAEQTVSKFVEGNHEPKTLSPAFAGIIRTTADLDPDMNALEQELCKYPVIADKVLNRANSTFYGLRADNIKQAFLNIGLEAVKAIALSTAAFDAVSDWGKKLDRTRFWRHSLEVAVTSRSLASKLNMRHPETNYTIGLLHDIGILVLDHINPDKYSQLFDLFMPDEDLAELEKQFFGADHCEVGSELLRKWNLPRSVWAPLQEHHNLCRNNDNDLHRARTIRNATILALADHISDMQFRPADHGVILSSQRLHLLMSACELAPQDIIEIKSEVAQIMVEEAGYLEQFVGSPAELAQQAGDAIRDHVTAMMTYINDQLEGEIKRTESNLSGVAKTQVREKYAQEMSIVDNLWTNLLALDSETHEIKDHTQIELLNHALRDFMFRLITFVVTGTSSAYDPEQDSHYSCPLFYGTNRKPEYSKGPSRRLIGFGKGSSNALHLGMVTVRVPRYRKLGSLTSGPIGRIIKPDDCIFVENIEELTPDTYWHRLTATLKATDDRSTPDLLIYIHGYWNSFDRAARRAAQLHLDLHVRGTTAFFAWPSACNPVGYVADLEMAQESADHLRRFLWMTAQKCRPANIHIIAHSMGNRALLTSIEKIADGVSHATGMPFAQIILAAPDVTVNQFKSLAHAYKRISVRTTIYVSKKDRAIGGSRLLRLKNMDLLGLVPPITIEDGMDTVEATRVDNTFLGHNYFCGSGPVLNDISAVINEGTPPEKRPNMIKKRSEHDERDYYQLLENSAGF